MNSVLLCDDHPLVREAIAATLRMHWPSVRLAEAGSYTAAWELAQEGFDLCICDLSMPGAVEEEGVSRLKQAAPDMPVLILTGSQDDALMLRLLQAGVNGFIEKSKGGKVLLAAIQLILAGERYIPARVLEYASQHGLADPRLSEPLMSAEQLLTAQQRKVVSLVAMGKSNKVIAQEMGVAPSTIKTHLEHAMRATASTSRFEVVSRARAAGLLDR